jgi:hypothetical protein
MRQAHITVSGSFVEVTLPWAGVAGNADACPYSSPTPPRACRKISAWCEVDIQPLFTKG